MHLVFSPLAGQFNLVVIIHHMLKSEIMRQAERSWTQASDSRLVHEVFVRTRLLIKRVMAWNEAVLIVC